MEQFNAHTQKTGSSPKAPKVPDDLPLHGSRLKGWKDITTAYTLLNMDIFSRNKSRQTIINKETQFVPIDELPENVMIVPHDDIIAKGLRINRYGLDSVVIDSTGSTVQILEPNTLLGKAYAMTPLKETKKRQTEAKVTAKAVA